MSLKKKIPIIILICFVSVIFAACTIVAYAYFSKKDIYDGYFSGQVELLFDRLNDEGVIAYQEALTADGETATVSKEADWGSKEYPYVISNVRHLYNLSELQRLGYFNTKFISQNTNGSYSKIPYFLVCKPDYTPALIDGSSFKNITAIGTDKFPFIGSVKGVKNTSTKIEVNGKSCDTSAICNVEVAGNPANVDAGLFGVIGYLGTAPTPTQDNPTPTFEGQISTVSDLVLSDVKVTVKSSAWDAVTSFVEDIMVNAANGHLFSFSELYNTADYTKVPHENHHIGILAGHAAYAKIEFISVYYSTEEMVAIDLTDATDVGGTKANYLSATGILGFIDNINPTVVDENGKQTITAGSGDSLGDISYGSVGGGGLASGAKAGYVLASEMYGKYRYTGAAGNLTADNDGTIFLKDALDKDGKALCTEWVRDRILWGTQRTGRYYFYDGVFTFALSDQADVIEPTWNILVDENDNPILDEKGNFTYDVPEFSIGQNDDSKWETNTSKGNKAIVAYIKEIKGDDDLKAAITAGKEIFIMQENPEDLFLMSLYNQSTAGSGNFEEKYTTSGTTQKFASDALVDGIVAAYNNGSLKLPTGEDNDMTPDYNTEAKVAAALDKGELKAINVGITSSEVSLVDLKREYKITPNITGNYSYFVGDTPVRVNTDGTIQQYYDYANSGYDGYIYYTEVQTSAAQKKYEYYWQPKEGSATLIGEATANWIFGWTGRNLPEDVFTDTNTDWQGENVYSCTFNSVPYTGVVVNKSAGAFYGSGNIADANGATLTKETTGTNAIYYLYNDVRTTTETDKKYHLWSDTAGTGTTYVLGKDENNKDILNDASGTTYTQNGESPSGKPVYKIGDNNYVLLDRYPTYTFSAKDKDNNTNYLRMIRATFNLFGTHYVLWNGTDTAANTASNFNHTYFIGASTPTVTNSTQATLRFNTDGTCYIQYSIGSTGLYVNSTGSVFNTAASGGAAGAKLRIYTVEGTQDISYGRITFDPIDDTTSDTDSYTFSAGTHVLVANPTHTRQNGDTGNITATNTGYTVTSLTDLSWNNGSGATLSQADLTSKFKMIKGITFGASFNLFNGTLGTSGIVTAPVGTAGVEANIPQSCIAFRINKPVEAAKIRVIVSVAVSEYYPGEKNGDKPLYDLGDYTRYFNLWKMEEAGESIIQIFNATGSNLMDRFEVPRSHPYEPGTAAKDAQHLTVKYNGADYRCYLNGDRVLVAYEFTVNTTDAGTGVGVYCLGMSGIKPDGSVQDDVPMEIVYFSADGVASSGRDGATGSQIGTIDFVYDYNNTVVTVTESSSTDADGNEDYNTYYPSYCLLYFNVNEHAPDYTDANPAFLPVNNETVKVRRYVDTTADSDINHNDTPSFSTLIYDLAGDKRVRIVQYSRFADNVREKNVALKE